jgi:hypothetical protein
MSVQDAESGDIYADEGGKLWRIIGVCHEPTVIAEEVEGTLRDPNAPRPPHAAAAVGMGWTQAITQQRATIEKLRKTGGTGGLMWSGWKRIWRSS